MICGFGVGVNLDVGKKVVEEFCDLIMNILKGVDMVFVIVGMGGGIGIGVVLVIVEIVKECGVFIVGVVICLFIFEGCKCFSYVE